MRLSTYPWVNGKTEAEIAARLRPPAPPRAVASRALEISDEVRRAARFRQRSTMSAPVVAVFCMPERGHLHRLLPLVAGFARRGVDTHVFTDAAYREPVERAGGRFVDLFLAIPSRTPTRRPGRSRRAT